MAIIDTEGVVTKETKYGDTSRILTVVTKQLGKISVLAGNVRRGKSGLLTAASLFSYSKFTLFKGGSSSLYKLNDGELIKSFSSLHESLDGMAFAAYFCDVTNCIVQEESVDIPQTELLIRSLYMLSRASDIRDLEERSAALEKVKAVFEIRSLALNGLMPELKACGNCGTSDKLHYLSPAEGHIYCDMCGRTHFGAIPINDSLLAAIAYIVLAPEKKEFSFNLSPKSVAYLSEVSERCAEVLLEHNFKTLDYLRKVTALG